MQRSFGIELEIIGITRANALRALQAININVVEEGYNHETRPHWKIVSDASVRGGFEVVSPVLTGDAGLRTAMAVAEALADAGATVNRTCGFHVHFDARRLSVDAIKTALRRYSECEAEIDAVMPASRRGDQNRYCMGLEADQIACILSQPTVEDMAAAQGSRYYKVNLQAFLRHGTIEFRQHSGTLNARKVANWVLFLSDFLDQCERDAAQPATTTVATCPALRGVLARLGQMFTTHRTVRLSAMCAEFGWQEHSARAAVTRLRQAGLQITASRVNGEAIYTLTSGLVEQPAPRAAGSIWTGITQSVVEFYRSRAAVLAAVSAA